MPGVTLRLLSGLTETDTFATRVYPRNELIQTESLKTNDPAVTAPPPARVDRVSRIPVQANSNCKAQTSSIWRLRVRPRRYSKLIKEDHFACTTKMSEFLVGSFRHFCVSNSAGSNPGSLPSSLKYTRDSRDHILAAIRLFTCQRANNRA
jgi:hypothetical protein